MAGRLHGGKPSLLVAGLVLQVGDVSGQERQSFVQGVVRTLKHVLLGQNTLVVRGGLFEQLVCFARRSVAAGPEQVFAVVPPLSGDVEPVAKPAQAAFARVCPLSLFDDRQYAADALGGPGIRRNLPGQFGQTAQEESFNVARPRLPGTQQGIQQANRVRLRFCIDGCLSKQGQRQVQRLLVL